jgi:SAM-dependent methyltransferase
MGTAGVTIVLRSAFPTDFPANGGFEVPADARRAARRSRDAWLAADAPSSIVLPGDPKAAGAGWELVVREPEAMALPGALEDLPLDFPAGVSLAPEGFFRGGSAPGEAYATVWQFEQEVSRRRSDVASRPTFGPGVVPPVELRRLGETTMARPQPGWVVHSFAGRRSWDRAELLRFVPPGTWKVLEVGCGEGAFAALLEAAGARVTAVEPDPSAAAIARGRASRIFEATLEDALQKLAGERFDLVVMADVLEHLMDPVAALRALKPLLAPDGAFLLSLPNASHAAVLAGILQGRWDHALEGIVADDHRTYAGRAGWDRLLAAAGLEVAEWVPATLATRSLSPWMGVLAWTGLPERDLLAVQWTGLARPGPRATPAGPGPRLETILPPGEGELDADDPVASVRALLLGREEVSLRSPNALSGPFVLPLFSGEIVSGEGRTALARGTTAHGLERRFRGSGIEIRVASGKAEGPPGLLRRLTDEALRVGLPAAPEAFAAPDLHLRFRREEP